jgi:hypothetical protein
VTGAHTCKPSYTRGRDQGFLVCSQSRQIVLENLFKKKKPPLKKSRAGGVGQVEGPEFKPQKQFYIFFQKNFLMIL